MSVKVGSVEVSGGGILPLSRDRYEAKQTLRSIGTLCGIENTYFVRTKIALHAGYYRYWDKTIIVVEKHKTKEIPMWKVAFYFFHELSHHLQREGGLFSAYYFKEAVVGGKKKKYTQADRRRVALRAEQHANQKACELAYEFFGLELAIPEYSKGFLEDWLNLQAKHTDARSSVG